MGKTSHGKGARSVIAGLSGPSRSAVGPSGTGSGCCGSGQGEEAVRGKVGKTSRRKGARCVIILVCWQRPERSPVRPSGMKGHPGLSAGETCLKRRVVSEKVLAGTEIQRSWGGGGKGGGGGGGRGTGRLVT